MSRHSQEELALFSTKSQKFNKKKYQSVIHYRYTRFLKSRIDRAPMLEDFRVKCRRRKIKSNRRATEEEEKKVTGDFELVEPDSGFASACRQAMMTAGKIFRITFL